MELNIKLRYYNITERKYTHYRFYITVTELDDRGRPTGRSWVEPYDPLRGKLKELEKRFNKRVQQDSTVVALKDDPPDEITDQDFVTSVATDALDSARGLMKPILNAVISDAIRAVQSAERLKREEEQYPPSQVITEAAIDTCVDRLGNAIEPVIGRVVKETLRANSFVASVVRHKRSFFKRLLFWKR